MRKLITYLVLLLLLSSCDNAEVDTPVWQNRTDTLIAPDFEIEFKGIDKGWDVILYTVMQPIKLKVLQNGKTLLASFPEHKGLIDGPAHLLFISGNQQLVFPVYLRNETNLIAFYKDYRSPKSIITDLSRQQHQMIHQIDAHRNLIPLSNGGLFHEEVLQLGTRTGIFLADDESLLTAFYINPGTAVSIPLKAKFNEKTKTYTVTAGPLVDQFKNMVSDGTLVSFHYSDSQFTWNHETTLLDGYSSISIPATSEDSVSVYAQVNMVKSNILKLKR